MSAVNGNNDIIETMHGYDLNIKNYEIYLIGIEDKFGDDQEVVEPGIEYRISNRFIRNLNILRTLDSKRPILIHMKTNGGEWDEGMAIYDSIRTAPNPITIINYTHASSMSSIIFQAANKRIMMPHSTFMFHQGSYGDMGTWKQVSSAFDFSKRTDEETLDIYVNVLKESEHGKLRSWSRMRIAKWLNEQMDKKEDVYLAASEAVAYGFADELFTDWGSTKEYTDEQLSRK